tara:strand:+ start:1999 stop:3177 length:1179 start_codon:yes stop_codon:yes gene_type:complete
LEYQFTDEQMEFKRNIDSFLRSALPLELANKVKTGAGVNKQELTNWTRILNKKGWAAPNWPIEHGGTGWNLIQRHIFDSCCRSMHAPALSGFGFNMVGPAIIKYGTEAQKADFLPKIRNADLWFCQGYSEPQAGSDLAGVATTAIKDGDEYIVNGSKIWTSGAEDADWIFCLVRTNGQVQKQKGISFLLIDLRSPGIEIKPLIAFNGKRLWNQVFFEDVRVPSSHRLGDEDHGWTVAKSLLGDERLMVSRIAENKRVFSNLLELVSQQGQRGQILPGSFHSKLSQISIRINALEMTSLRILGRADKGAEVGAEPSMLKLKGSELVQSQDELLFELVDYLSVPLDSSMGDHQSVGSPMTEYISSGAYHHRGYTIAGGSSEVQHNIIAKQVLGL